MHDDFFDDHDVTTGTFAVGIVVIMSLIIGAGVAAFLFVMSLQSIAGDFSNKVFASILLPLEVVWSIAITVTNVIIIVKGKPEAVIANKVNVYIQIACYSFFALTFMGRDSWFGLMFVAFPLFAFWLMSTAKYQAFVGFYEAIRKDPEGYRRRVLGD